MGLKDNGQTATTADSKARMLNNQFVSVFTDEDIENMPEVEEVVIADNACRQEPFWSAKFLLTS